MVKTDTISQVESWYQVYLSSIPPYLPHLGILSLIHLSRSRPLWPGFLPSPGNTEHLGSQRHTHRGEKWSQSMSHLVGRNQIIRAGGPSPGSLQSITP